MSIFKELLPKISDISDAYTKNFNDDLKVAFECFDHFEEEFHNGRGKTREKSQKDKNAMTTLQSINEDEDEPKKQEPEPEANSVEQVDEASSCSSNESNQKRRASKKRNKNEVDGILSPAQEKRLKRNASVVAQSIISQQVNVNLTQKLRRENSIDKLDKNQPAKGRRRKDDEKENQAPILPAIQIKEEKISIPPEPEPMEAEQLHITTTVKREPDDSMAMPPPALPVPKPRRAPAKEKPTEETSEEESTVRRSTRTRKQTDTVPQPVTRSSRSTRASSRTQRSPERSSVAAAPEARPRRARTKKKLSETSRDSDVTQGSAPASPAEKPRPKRTRRAQKATEKPQPKPVELATTTISPKEERMSQPEPPSPILPHKEIKTLKNNKKDKTVQDLDFTKTEDLTKTQSAEQSLTKTDSVDKDLAKIENVEKELTKTNSVEKELTKTDSIEKDLAKIKNSDTELLKTKNAEKELAKSKTTEKELAKSKTTEKELAKSKMTEKELAKSKTTEKEMAKTNIIEKELVLTKSAENDEVDNVSIEETSAIVKNIEMDQTMVLTNGVYNHVPETPKNICHMNETVTRDKCNQDIMDITKTQNTIMNVTVVLDKDPQIEGFVDDFDNSLLTDDSDEIAHTPPKQEIPPVQPLSAVKEKVQQFEEMASRVTRTKTRAMAKKEEQADSQDTQTPPDKSSKVILSSETLTKMNNLIFNGKLPQVSSSASKLRAPVPISKLPSSASKLSATRVREAEEALRGEDARKKKEAMLEAKREQQRRKREEKMSAAAAARSAAERARAAALAAADRERRQRQNHADHERQERARDQERKKQELARKVAETEERRRAEEAARQQRLAEEQRRAAEQRRKQIEEQEAMRKEAAIMAKEFEQKHREYLEKQKKQRHEERMTPFKTPGTPRARPDPVYMQDGFQYLNSDEEAEPVDCPVPQWSTSKARRAQLCRQASVASCHIDRLFSVRVHSPDLRELFPNIERARLKRTSSAVWRTPPQLKTVPE